MNAAKAAGTLAMMFSLPADRSLHVQRRLDLKERKKEK